MNDESKAGQLVWTVNWSIEPKIVYLWAGVLKPSHQARVMAGEPTWIKQLI